MQSTPDLTLPPYDAHAISQSYFLNRLETETSLNLFEFYELAQKITPIELKTIIQNRTKEGLSPLPCCENLSVYEDFLKESGQQFNQAQVDYILLYMRHYNLSKKHLLNISSIEMGINMFMFGFFVLTGLYLILDFVMLLRAKPSNEAVYHLMNQTRIKLYTNVTQTQYDDFDFNHEGIHWEHSIVYNTTNVTHIDLSAIFLPAWGDAIHDVARKVDTFYIFGLMSVALLAHFASYIPYVKESLSKTPDFLLSSDLVTQCKIAILRLQTYSGRNFEFPHKKADVLTIILNKIIQDVELRDEKRVCFDDLKKKYSFDYKVNSTRMASQVHMSFLEAACITERTHNPAFTLKHFAPRTATSALLNRSIFKTTNQLSVHENTPLLETNRQVELV